jgi:hypothetical protein
MTQDEIIEMAQECGLIGMRPHLDGIYSEALVAFAKLVAAKAIAELESQEPVCPDCKAKVLYECVACSSNNYPPQRTWVGLTDEEENEYNYLGPDMHWVIQEIAAKLKEKNT